jgi:hypothetical protein
MKRHSTDLFSMFFGLTFVTIGGVFLTGRVDVTDIGARWMWPLPLILAGLLILAAALRREPRPFARDEAIFADGDVAGAPAEDYDAAAESEPEAESEPLEAESESAFESESESESPFQSASESESESESPFQSATGFESEPKSASESESDEDI